MDQNDKKRVISFVNHLLNNPNIKNEAPVIREGMIISFITNNLGQIKKSLSSPQFFPNISTDRVIKEILIILKQMSLRYVIPQMEDWLNKKINFAIIEELFPLRGQGYEAYRSMIQNYLNAILSYNDVRYNFNCIINIFKFGVFERYFPEIFHRRKYIYNEIKRVEKFDLDYDEYIEYAKIIFLIRNAVYTRIPISTESGTRKANLNEARRLSISIKDFIEKQRRSIHKSLPFLNEKAIVTAIKSNLKERFTQLEDASARLFYIFASRYQDYKHYSDIDRGAESLDKSWFGIARTNSSFYGFNKKMVDELYLIAGDNMW